MVYGIGIAVLVIVLVSGVFKPPSEFFIWAVFGILGAYGVVVLWTLWGNILDRYVAWILKRYGVTVVGGAADSKVVVHTEVEHGILAEIQIRWAVKRSTRMVLHLMKRINKINKT